MTPMAVRHQGSAIRLWGTSPATGLVSAPMPDGEVTWLVPTPPDQAKRRGVWGRLTAAPQTLPLLGSQSFCKACLALLASVCGECNPQRFGIRDQHTQAFCARDGRVEQVA